VQYLPYMGSQPNWLPYRYVYAALYHARRGHSTACSITYLANRSGAA
jgi:hypothetical protein